ncbi:RagB/SusD family nutrient uptake outer membrane protein [Arcicella lustrica]|uniref:RagB/SusD family nutrient uptake outer membrane protein n=1 Tax=Arcicella lustrica TaxID=2984196 RepID=A0ABU5SFC4_9BACT|nr:RagB/SusD family nutrient uptake outer membrane protein [Arcicella sp. DC25W]MEA5425990.1 RagB/SusD family nutrient uptake outer membrane protein [Arcicella sp. DC25W]
MKKITILLLSLALVACKDSFLELTPDTNGSVDNFYQTKEQFIQAVNAAYSPLQGIETGSLWLFAEMRSDNTSYQQNTSDRSGTIREELDEFRENDQNANFQSFFSASYLGISRCNLLLTKLSSATFDQATRDRLEGEARFLRAFYYFNLTRVFGDVPLILKEVNSPEDAFSTAPRVLETEVYKAIIDDFKVAIAKLPASFLGADLGRATSGAAKTLLAKVYLTQKNYTAANDLLKTIETEGAYQLNANYADNFKKKNTAESIFEIQYVEGPGGKSSNFAYSFAPYNSGTIVTGFALASGAAAGWNIPTQDLMDAYEAGDKRFTASINTAFTDPTSKKVIPYIQKYANPPYLERFNTGDNFIVTRLADVLLMQAEALNEISFPNQTAFDLLNRVRLRAGLSAKTQVNITSQSAMRAAIQQERRVELAFENHRWFDLVRTGDAVAVMTAHAIKEKALKSYILPSSFATIALKFPYPYRETQITTTK